jgi:hypothetical protein
LVWAINLPTDANEPPVETNEPPIANADPVVEPTAALAIPLDTSEKNSIPGFLNRLPPPDSTIEPEVAA